jgi:hypothetical protein
VGGLPADAEVIRDVIPPISRATRRDDVPCLVLFEQAAQLPRRCEAPVVIVRQQVAQPVECVARALHESAILVSIEDCGIRTAVRLEFANDATTMTSHRLERFNAPTSSSSDRVAFAPIFWFESERLASDDVRSAI